MLEIDRQNPFQSELAFGRERVIEGAINIDLSNTTILAIDTIDGTRGFFIQSPDGAVTVTLRGLTSDSELKSK